MKSDRHHRLSPNASSGSGANEAEPTASLVPAPIWLIVLFGVLVYWGEIYMDNYGGQFNAQVYEPYTSFEDVSNANPKSGDEQLVAQGKALYEKVCIGCHQGNGLGGASPPAPPLAGSDWVTAPGPFRIIRIPLHGLNGPVKVSGQDFNLTMAALGTTLSNEDLAAILSYVRNAWGNKASIVTPQQVEAVRAETKDRKEDGSQPWTADELLRIPDTP